MNLKDHVLKKNFDHCPENFTDLTAVHCISESIGALYDLPHGVANSIFLPHVLAYNLPACKEKMADLARKSGFMALDDEAAAQLFKFVQSKVAGSENT